MDMIVGTQQLADIIGKTPKWVNTLTRDGILVQVSRGKYELPENIQRYVEYVRGAGEDPEGINYNDEKAKHERAKRKLAELELAEKEGELIQVGEVEQLLSKMIGLFKSRCQTIPTKVAPLVQYEQELPKITVILKKEVAEALQELSDQYRDFAKKMGQEEGLEESEDPEAD